MPALGAVFFAVFSACLPSARAQEGVAGGGGRVPVSCREDLKRFCGDSRRLFKCLREHEDVLSEGCKSDVDEKIRQGETARAVCADDQLRFCAEEGPSVQEIRRCMRKHKDELSEKCRSAVLGLLSPAADRGAVQAPDGAFPGKAEALELARLLAGRPEAAQLEAFLNILRADAQDIDAQVALKKAAYDLYAAELRKMEAAPGPDSGSPASARRAAYARFLAGQGNDAVFDLCLEAVAAFEDGRYLRARDGLALCGQMKIRPGMRKFVAIYRNRLGYLADGDAILPKEEPERSRFALALRALGILRWSTALDMVRGLLAARAPSVQAAELQDMQRRLEERVAAEESFGLEGARYLDSLRDLTQRDSWRASEGLLASLGAARLYSRPDLADRAQELLLRCRTQGGAQRSLEEARRAYAVGNSTAAAHLLVEILEKDPENKDVLSLLRGGRTPEQDAAIRAEAFYTRGLRAYLDGDAARAEREWREALKADARMEKARKALARVLGEAKLAQEGGGKGER
ncbi:MAG TPA: hypothetical protein VNI01_15395 [Elusimicrobiota bacterium]|nr:hypothetical protein [Elusimicrobiota bacterium]